MMIVDLFFCHVDHRLMSNLPDSVTSMSTSGSSTGMYTFGSGT